MDFIVDIYIENFMGHQSAKWYDIEFMEFTGYAQ